MYGCLGCLYDSARATEPDGAPFRGSPSLHASADCFITPARESKGRQRPVAFHFQAELTGFPPSGPGFRPVRARNLSALPLTISAT